MELFEKIAHALPPISNRSRIAIIGDLTDHDSSLGLILESGFEVFEYDCLEDLLNQSIQIQAKVIIITGEIANYSAMRTVGELRKSKIGGEIIIIKDLINPHMWHELLKAGVRYIFQKPIQIVSIMELCTRLCTLDQDASKNAVLDVTTRPERYFFSVDWVTELGSALEQLLVIIAEDKGSFLIESPAGFLPHSMISLLVRANDEESDSDVAPMHPFRYITELETDNDATQSLLEKHCLDKDPTTRIILSAERSADELLELGLISDAVCYKLCMDTVRLPRPSSVIDDLPTFAQWWASVCRPPSFKGRLRISENGKEWIRHTFPLHDWPFILGVIEGASTEAFKRVDLVRVEDLQKVRRQLLFGKAFNRIATFPIFQQRQRQEFSRAIKLLREEGLC